ncbi:D-inositol-3-phosphate glycosyltransferase [Nakamurella flavida]|uniref:D-inositol-3-phosphate glycosyltransferase n=1 Tax=Nakamurella flavida TaxID=363630 RepID=UPI00278564E6|nr:D-inositol-3-phosphate glycosyltransferase [Nakamurella flavida]MDP9778326.1 D-inositol-3-phosphate glycosyltransferase [Nakamurella flavida]
MSAEQSSLPHRVALISLHTSPLAQAGGGDAGGMNVYVAQTARRLADRGVQVEIFTRATGSDQPPVVHWHPGVLVRHVVAGPFEGLDKIDLPGQLCSFTAGVLRAEAAREPGHYDLVHSHYWLSGQVGYLAKDRWAVPLVHSAHTLAKVKNAALADGDRPEPFGRVVGEEQVVVEADRLVANTATEARELIELYGADPARVDVVAPGVDTDVFRPGDRSRARARLGLPADARLIVFAGRIQPLKAPDVLVRALGELHRRSPDDRWRLVVVGGVSGSVTTSPDSLRELAAAEGVADRLEFRPPVAPELLAEYFRAADVVGVPSHNESFGLVALEAQAVGTPVVAAARGGLTVAVRDDESGLLLPGHDARDWADALGRICRDAALRERLSAGAVRQAAAFSWEHTVEKLLDTYRRAIADAAAARHPGRSVPAGTGERVGSR